MNNTTKSASRNAIKKTIVSCLHISKPVGAYSQAILSDKTLYVSGVLGMDPEGQLICGGVEAQTKQALDNLKHVLEAGGASFESVIKTTILLTRMNDFQLVNQIYGQYFSKNAPARATFQVAALPRDADVEIEAVALSGDLTVADCGPCPCLRMCSSCQDKVTKIIITSPDIYKPVGPYSQAILAEKTLYVSGVLGMNSNAEFVCGGVKEQTKQALDNLKHVLKAGGASLESVIKTTILLSRMEDFQVVNQIYGEYFPKNAPARATFQVAKLPRDAAVEIEAIALSGDLVVKDGICKST